MSQDPKSNREVNQQTHHTTLWCTVLAACLVQLCHHQTETVLTFEDKGYIVFPTTLHFFLPLG